MNARQAVIAIRSIGGWLVARPGERAYVHSSIWPIGRYRAGMHAHATWATRLRKAMDAAGFDGAGDLARAAGLNYSVVRRWLAGEGTPTVDNLRAISSPLRVPLIQLIVWAGLLSSEEARLDASAPAQITPEEALRSDPTLTEDGRRAGLASLEGLRKAFSSTPDAGRRRRSGA